MENDRIIADEKSRKAVHAARDAAHAVEVARLAQAEATKKDTTDALSDALRQVFGEHENSRRFIDITRIPLICKSIIDIHENLKDIKNDLQNNQYNIKDIKGLVTHNDDDHEARIRVIERNQWKWIGVVAVITPVLTIGLGVLLTVLFKH